ncbi:MAG: hypothetical protein AB4042_19610, partial [Leptolyngbyaceae cyanobacterium]
IASLHPLRPIRVIAQLWLDNNPLNILKNIRVIARLIDDARLMIARFIYDTPAPAIEWSVER